jgi:hypothetical protein
MASLIFLIFLSLRRIGYRQLSDEEMIRCGTGRGLAAALVPTELWVNRLAFNRCHREYFFLEESVMKKYAKYVLLVLVCSASGAFATTYNMINDWTPYPNPHPANWNFGSKVETDYSSGVFGDFVAAPRENAIWWLDRYLTPDTYESTWVGMSAIDIWIPIGKITAEPWVVTAAVAHFSGADAGTYNLTAVFKGVGPSATPVGQRIVYVQKNGGTIWSSALNGYDTVSAAQQVTLASGDYLDFIVTDAHNYSNGAATMDATLTLIPEPATMILLGLGGLLLRKRK